MHPRLRGVRADSANAKFIHAIIYTFAHKVPYLQFCPRPPSKYLKSQKSCFDYDGKFVTIRCRIGRALAAIVPSIMRKQFSRRFDGPTRMVNRAGSFDKSSNSGRGGACHFFEFPLNRTTTAGTATTGSAGSAALLGRASDGAIAGWRPPCCRGGQFETGDGRTGQ